MISFLKRIIHLFRKEDVPQFVLFFVGIGLNSFLEVIGIGLLLPFMAVLANPDALEKEALFKRLYDLSGCRSYEQFLIWIALTIIGVFVIKNILFFVTSYWQRKFVLRKQVFLVSRLFNAYLMSPYAFHLRENFARLQWKLEGVFIIMNGMIIHLFTVLTEGMIVACLFMVLVVTRTAMTLGVTAVLAGTLAIYFAVTRKKFHQWSTLGGEKRVLVLQQMNQGLGSIKEVKLFGKESFFVERYRSFWDQLSQQLLKCEIVQNSPRSFIEMIVIALVMTTLILFIKFGESLQSIFMTISLMTIVAVRLMPSLNRIAGSWAQIKSNMYILDSVYEDLISCEQAQQVSQKRAFARDISFERTVEVKDVSFQYENAQTPSLEKVSFLMHKNTTIGFVGPSGAGKTTVIDVILGLLEPSEGKVLVDEVDIYDNVRLWQEKIGCIPQAIYLCNESIRANIAFGIASEGVSDEKVWRALSLAQLDGFVRSLPQGLDTEIGERGVRLSGGQRQRIGIARALYNDPEVLVMDEATAALDNETERAFMEALFNLSGKKTIPIVAHRLTTVQRCDEIFYMRSGKVLGSGSYDALIKSCPDFSQMAGQGHF